MAALLALLRQRSGGASWNEIAAEVSELPGALSRSSMSLPTTRSSRCHPTWQAQLKQAQADVRAWADAGYRPVTVLDPEYPSRLLGIREIPPFLFYEGTLREPDDGMSVVGSRSASDWGLKLTAEAARFLVAEGLTVIAGLAAGIDTAAHQAALDADGRTVAFLGTGITQSYPASNRALQREIAVSRTSLFAVLSGCTANQALVPNAERHHVRVWTRDHRHRGGRTLRHSHPGTRRGRARSAGSSSRTVFLQPRPRGGQP